MARRRQDWGSIRKLPSGRWQARVRDPVTNQLVSAGTFRTRAEANKALSDVAVKQGKGRWVNPRGARITLAEWVDEWMQTRQHLRPATVVSYRYLTGLAVADLGRMRLDQLDVHAVAVWLSGLHSRESLSPSTAVRAYRMLSQVLGDAVKAKRISENPCVVTGAGVTAKRDLNVPTVAEALAMADSMPARLRALVIVWALCGLPFGETLGLQRGDVGLKNRTLRIQRQVTEVQGTQRVAELKTGAGRRTIDLPQMVVTALEEHLARWVDEDPGTFLFKGPRGGIQRRKGVYAEWWKARQRLGLEGVRIHDLRHLSGTLGAISGATPKEQMARMGHADSRMALHYQHIVAGRGRTIADGIDKLVQTAEQLDAEAD